MTTKNMSNVTCKNANGASFDIAIVPNGQDIFDQASGARTYASMNYGTWPRGSPVHQVHGEVEVLHVRALLDGAPKFGMLSEDDQKYMLGIGFDYSVMALAITRSLVQSCCEPNNKLHQPNSNNDNCRMINITIEDDFTTSHGIGKATEAITGAADALWGSLPCVGASAIQQLNIAIRGDVARAKIEGHFKLFRQLWKSFETVF